jgi:hypothetical protein
MKKSLLFLLASASLFGATTTITQTVNLSLLAAVRAHGMTPSRGLLVAARRICPHLETPLAAEER